GTTTAIGTGWTDAITTGVPSWDPSTNAAITFSGELTSAGAGALIARAVVDGKALPGEVTVLPAGTPFASAAVEFHAKHRLLGFHNVTVQVRSTSGTGYVADRAIAIPFKHRGGADFAQPLNIHGVGIVQPRHRSYNQLVLCFDPKRYGASSPIFQPGELQQY